MDIGGAYTVDRAASLSGVPKRTVTSWARTGLLLPSVAQSPRLWSFMDLLALRTIYWPRQSRQAFDIGVPTTTMPRVRQALAQLQDLKLDLLAEGHSAVGVTLSGRVVITPRDTSLPPDAVDVLGPFKGLECAQGPDLLRPRPTLRIFPRRISGTPHIDGTRLPTQSISALADRGFTVEDVSRIYPFVSLEALKESIELERQLQWNANLRCA
jgi:uncharacterized protein (DUF433 family)